MAKSDLNAVNELVIYESILRLSEEMVDASKGENWDGIIALEKNRRILIDHLKKRSTAGTPEDKDQFKMVNLIQKILSADKQTERNTKTRMEHLRNGFETERKLLKTYSNYAVSA